MSKLKIETGSSPARGRFSITVTEEGPYLVYGRPPLAEQFIMPNRVQRKLVFPAGQAFSTEAEPTAICRCGASHRKPYCDGSHEKADWDPRLTARPDALLNDAEVIDGGTLQMTDNEKYCVFARFCHPHGDAWTLTEASDDPEARKLAIREASMCPSGRLTAWDKETMKPFEFRFEPSLGLIEDITIGASGGLWIRGGIPMRREGGHTYEIRNRVVACRCGQSANKPYCDGTHASIKWKDGLAGEPVGETPARRGILSSSPHHTATGRHGTAQPERRQGCAGRGNGPAAHGKRDAHASLLYYNTLQKLTYTKTRCNRRWLSYIRDKIRPSGAGCSSGSSATGGRPLRSIAAALETPTTPQPRGCRASERASRPAPSLSRTCP